MGNMLIRFVDVVLQLQQHNTTTIILILRLDSFSLFLSSPSPDCFSSYLAMRCLASFSIFIYGEGEEEEEGEYELLLLFLITLR